MSRESNGELGVVPASGSHCSQEHREMSGLPFIRLPSELPPIKCATLSSALCFRVYFSTRTFKATPVICLVFLSYEPKVFPLTPVHLHGCCCDGSSAKGNGSTGLGGGVPREQGHHASIWWDSEPHLAPLKTSLEKSLSYFPSVKLPFRAYKNKKQS